jgi:hypothetical protein
MQHNIHDCPSQYGVPNSRQSNFAKSREIEDVYTHSLTHKYTIVASSCTKLSTFTFYCASFVFIVRICVDRVIKSSRRNNNRKSKLFFTINVFKLDPRRKFSIFSPIKSRERCRADLIRKSVYFWRCKNTLQN